jgi:hypothetical protein
MPDTTPADHLIHRSAFLLPVIIQQDLSAFFLTNWLLVRLCSMVIRRNWSFIINVAYLDLTVHVNYSIDALGSGSRADHTIYGYLPSFLLRWWQGEYVDYPWDWWHVLYWSCQSEDYMKCRVTNNPFLVTLTWSQLYPNRSSSSFSYSGYAHGWFHLTTGTIKLWSPSCTESKFYPSPTHSSI